MASRAISRLWQFRDLPRAYVLVVLAAFVVAVLSYFIDWSAVRRKTAPEPPPAANLTPEQRYTGSIFVPTRDRSMCWEMKFDNRTGTMQDKGYVKCAVATPVSVEQAPAEGADAARLREVGKAFRHQNN